jgi:hypothetical protein
MLDGGVREELQTRERSAHIVAVRGVREEMEGDGKRWRKWIVVVLEEELQGHERRPQLPLVEERTERRRIARNRRLRHICA